MIPLLIVATPQPVRTRERRFQRNLVVSRRMIVLVVFATVLTACEAWSQEYVLHSFTSLPDGQNPWAGLVLDNAGNLYGTTFDGGANGAGTVFELAHSTGSWKETVLHSFTGAYGADDGGYPNAGLIFDNAGNLYGTVCCGGANRGGTVFELSPSSGGWTETILHSFPINTGGDGFAPQAGLIFDSAGNLYGTTSQGGNGYGTVFQLTPSSGGWTETILHSFTDSDGSEPFASLIFDSAGNLYGTTSYGGATGHGTVFELTPSSRGWTENVLYSFRSNSVAGCLPTDGPGDGCYPGAGLIFDKAGNLYGTTVEGGANGYGAVFELTPSNGDWTETLLYSFTNGASDGSDPVAGLILDKVGNLYGTARSSPNGCGTVFELSHSNGGWTETVLHSFTGSDGSYPKAGLIFDSVGNLYGTTFYGGTAGYGIVFEIPISTQNIGSTGPGNPQATYAEPVSTGNGNYFYQHSDFSIADRGIPLLFARSYNALGTYSGPMGSNWTHSYNVLLTDAVSSVLIQLGDGHTENYVLSAGVYVPPPGVYNTLVKNTDGTYLLTQKDLTRYNFSSVGKLSSVADKDGNQVLFSYDGNGNLIQITDTVGRKFTLAYDSSNRITQIKDPIGRTELFTYSSNNDLATVTDSLKGLTTYGYDSSHHVTSIVLPGSTTLLTNVYDSSGRVITQANGRNFTTTFAYGVPAIGQTTITDPLGNKAIHTYDTLLRIVQIADALTGTVSYTYDANNNRTSVTNQNGNVTSYSYDSLGNVLGVTNALQGASAFTYDGNNCLLTSTNSRGNTTTFTYDSNCNLLTAQDARSDKTIFAYDSHGELTSKTDANGHTTKYAYNSHGNLVTITDALTHATKMGYDGISRLTSVTDANGNKTTSSYDALSRLTKTVDPLGNATQFKYSPTSNLTKVTDANGNSTTYAYDATNNLTSVTDAAAHVTKYAYDGNNNRTSFTNASKKTTSYAYDQLNRLATITDPLAFKTSYTYDAVGNVASKADANGHATQFTYDALNRVTGISYFDGNSVAYAYDADGDRTNMVDSRGTTTYAYDALDRLTSVTDPLSAVVAYTYDPVGHRGSVTYPGSQTVAYAYDAANRLNSVTDWLSRTTNYAYDPTNKLLSAAYPNTATVGFAYDSASRLTQVSNGYPASAIGPAGQFSTFTYALDKVGNRVSMTDGNGQATSYGYDHLYELTSATNVNGTTSYTYDAAGNRLTLTSPVNGTTSYKYDADDRLVSAGTTSFTYDKNGNRTGQKTSAQTLTYKYDAASRLVSVSGGSQASAFTYDGDGNRVTQSVGSGTYAYTNDVASPLPVVAQENGPDGFISYAYGLGLISESSSAFSYFYHPDGLGSTVGLTDASGALQQGYVYDAWGNNGGAANYVGTANKFSYTAQALDPGTSLYFLRARYYDPAVGNLLSRDPVPGLATRPATRQAYLYALNNPILMTDPSGRTPLDASQSGAFAQFSDYLGSAAQESLQDLADPFIREAGGYLGANGVPISPATVGKVAAFTILLGPVTSVVQSTFDAANHPERSILEDLQRGSIDLAITTTLTLGSAIPSPASPAFGAYSVLYGANRVQVQNNILEHFGGWMHIGSTLNW